MSRRRRLLFAIASIIAGVNAQGSPKDYAPSTNVPCPDVNSSPLVRDFTPQNQTLHPAELEYISVRESSVLPTAWRDWLGDGSGIGYDLKRFKGKTPRLGMAFSGGGFRASQYGAGALNAFDIRNESAKNAGTGGLLQTTSYVAGLSGGSWLLGSLFMNNWPTVKDLVFGNGNELSGWLLDMNLVLPNGTNLEGQNQWFFRSIIWSVMSKAEKGIDTSMTDSWSRMISYHFLNQTSRENFFTNDTAHGAGQLWSQIPLLPSFQQKQAPFPIVVADSRPVGSNLTSTLPLEPIVYEVSPLEFGSFDTNLSAMVNLSFAGSHLSNGQPANSSSCVNGFDQAGFIMGTSASVFNAFLDSARNSLDSFGANDGSGLLYLLDRLLQNVRTRAYDVANWPSPFNGIKPGTFLESNATWLELIDGSSNVENIPLGPLFVKARALDVIVAVDGSDDDQVMHWPNGTSLLFTATRLKNLLSSSHQQFPPIPSSVSDFINTGATLRPTFYGCDPQQSPPEFPLVIYLPNTPPANGDDPVTNTPTFKIQYTLNHTSLFLDQVHRNTISGFKPNSLGADPNWPKCLQCAAIDRSRLKLRPVLGRSQVCTQCFQQYCFDPAHPPSKDQVPGRKLNFKDPDALPGDPAPQGNKAEDGISPPLLIVGTVGILALVGALIALGICLRRRIRRRRKQAKGPAYRKVTGTDEEPRMTHPAKQKY